jgi:hypothetical protein
VVTIWAVVVAEVLGFENNEALTIGRAVAGLNAYSKGVSPGLFQPTPKEIKEQRRKMRKEETVTVDLLRRALPPKHTDEGLRALSGESPIGQGVNQVLINLQQNALKAAPGCETVKLSIWGTSTISTPSSP